MIPHAYGSSLLAGLLLGLGWFVFTQRNKPARLHGLVAAAQATLGAFLGAWAVSAWLLDGRAALSVRGALVGAGVAAGLYAWRYDLALRDLADAAAGPLLLTEFVGRLGCVLGDCSHGGNSAYALSSLAALVLFTLLMRSVSAPAFPLYLVLSALGRLAALAFGSPGPGSGAMAVLDLGFLICGCLLWTVPSPRK